MRTSLPTLALALAAAAALSWPVPACSAPIRILSADDRGVTLQVGAENWSLAAPDRVTGRTRIVGVPEARSLSTPGRALLPSYSGMLAIPPDARPSIRVLTRGVETTREGVRLAIAGRPGFHPDPDGGPELPVMEKVDPIVDGAWPAEEVVLGAPTSFRGRRLVSFDVRPFRYDEGASRLSAVAGYTVRIDFNRPAAARALATSGHQPDPGIDAALATSVLNFEQARAWRETPGASGGGSLFAKPSAAAALDENDPEVRVKVDSTGLYQLPFDLLSPAGYPGSVPIAQVSVHRHEFLEGATPPYATVEVPVEVVDVDENGVFNSGDFILMYARNWAARSGASQYQRWWGDADAVFVTRLLAGGARMSTRAGWRGAPGLTPLASFPRKDHLEKNGAIIMPFVWVPSDTSIDVFHWTPYNFYSPRPDTILFDANDPDSTHATSLTVNWVGRSFDSHYEWAAVRNGLGQLTTVADSVTWNGKRPFTASVTMFGSALTPGRTNALRVWGRKNANQGPPTPNAFDPAGLNWFEVTYWRRFRALDGILEFNSADAAGEFQIKAERFLADSVRLYDVTNPEQPVRLLVDEAQFQRGSVVSFDFQDSTATGARRSYVAGAIEYGNPDYGPRTPPASHFTAVTRRQLSAAPRPDYLLIVPEAFLPAVQPLVNLRASQGLGVLVATTESVYDEFNGGRHSGAAIQRFVRYAYQNWDSRFVLLFGDGSIDPQRLSDRSGEDWVPTLPIPGPVAVSEGFEVVPGDATYGCLTGNCNPQGFGPVLTEMMIGRLPVNSLADANNVVAKLVAYETLSGDQDWRRHLLLMSDDAFSGDTFFGGGGGSSLCYGHKDDEEHFVGLNTKCASIVNRDAGLSLTNAELFNLRYYLAGEPWTYTPPADTCRPDRSATQGRTHASVTPQMFAKLNAGVLWWNFQGHANEYVLTHENLYVNSGDVPSSDDKFMFANVGKPFLFSAFSCHANMFARDNGGPGTPLGGCLGEDMLTLPVTGGAGGAGAIASWASVCYEVVPRDDSTHINVELARSLFADPPVDEFVPGDHGARVVLGEAFMASMLRYVPVGGQYYGEQGIALTYTLLGDPATRMSVGAPQPVVTANDIPVVEGTPVRVHTVGDTVRFVADLVSAERLDSLGVFENLGAGDVPVSAAAYTVNPPFPDTAGGGQFGGRRFRVVYRTQPPAHNATYLFRVRDRNGLQTDFTATMLLGSTLRVDGVPIQDGDDVSPRANLSLYVVSPKPLNPATDLTLTVNTQPQVFTATPAPGDASGREWVLSWAHEDYLVGSYGVDLAVAGGEVLSHSFAVSTAVGDLVVENLIAFPNPFDAFGTRFSFALKGSDPADVKIDVYTISGRRLNSLVHRDLAPGYHQLAWDGNDAEGSALANGVYLYRLSAVTPSGKHVEQLGRLVKLRKPRRVEVESTP